jgi:hypothetical protein
MDGSLALGILTVGGQRRGGSFVKLVQRLARVGQLLLALAAPVAALGAPRKWS